MIDIHCHILPEIDDGARDLDESLSLCRIAERQNTKKIVATPHFIDYDNLNDFLIQRESVYSILVAAIEELGINVDIVLGSELFLSDHLFFAPNIDELTINNSRYMLVELPLSCFEINKGMQYIEEIISRGYVPILAHPERYLTFHSNPNAINELCDLGVLFQVNADSLLGLNGAPAFQLACDMVIENLVDFIASDAHSPSFRANDMFDKSKFFPEILSKEKLKWMLEEAPNIVINDDDFPYIKRGRI